MRPMRINQRTFGSSTSRGGSPTTRRVSPTLCRGGFTLVELLVALALSAVIAVSIMFISTQARSAYDETVKKVSVYNLFRYALQTVEQDLRNWIPTGDLDFYFDGAGQGLVNAHWDPGEESKDESDERGPGVVDGGVMGEYDEFAYILEKTYRSREPGQADIKEHAAFEMYFRTFTYIDGGVRVANVEYVLADPQVEWEKGRPVLPDFVENQDVAKLSLIKIIRYQDITQDIVKKQTEIPVYRRVVEVATNVTDFKVEYTVENRFASRHARTTPGFRTPRQDYEKPVERVLQPKLEGGANAPGGRRFRKRFGYGTVKLGAKDFPKAVAYPAKRGDEHLQATSHEPVRIGFQNDPKITFGELTAGDSIWFFTESTRAEAVGAVGSTGNAGKLIRFPAGDYTVKTNRQGLLELKEDIDSSTWNDERQSNIFYKAGFVPTAVRVTLRIVDDNGQNPKTMQREVWLRQRNR